VRNTGSRPANASLIVAAFVALATVVWFNNGIGAILPELEDEIGEWVSAVYPLAPGAVMFVWSLTLVLRGRPSPIRGDRVRRMIAGAVGLTVGVLLMGIAGVPPVSVAGVFGASFAAAYAARALTAVLKSESGPAIDAVLMRGNAYASVASVAAPWAVAASLAIGAGWLPGMAVPIGVGAVVIALTTHHRTPVVADPHVDHVSEAPAPPLHVWWREYAALAVAIVVEFCFVFFAATYLHDELGMSKAASAGGAAAWGAGMATGRFVLSTRPPIKSVVPSVLVVAIGFVMLWATTNDIVAIAGIAVAGLGAAPLYPSRLAHLLKRFPESPDAGALRALLASGAAVLTAPALIAMVRAVSDVRTAFLVVPVLLVILLALAHDSNRLSPH